MKLIYLILLLIPSFLTSQESPYSWVHSVHTTMGVPFDGDTTDDYIIVRDQYVLSYNKYKNGANWVAWELNKDWIGDVDRYKGNFITDTSLPADFYRVTHSDFTHSGYDRGHMVMSKQRSKTETDNISTFLLTNVLPQTPDLNRGVWLKLEMYCNKLALDSNKELFIYAGAIWHSNTTINDIVAVPDSFYKVIYVFDRDKKPYRKEEAERIISVVMPNVQGVRKDEWEKYLGEYKGYKF